MASQTCLSSLLEMYLISHILDKEKQENCSDKIGSDRHTGKKSKLIILKNKKLTNKRTHIKNELKFAQEVINQFRIKTNEAEDSRRERLAKKKIGKGKMLSLFAKKDKDKNKTNKLANRLNSVKEAPTSIYERIYSCKNAKSSLPPPNDPSSNYISKIT
ncbi:unnamed protein product [Moneuplotes crassus]|uniref:Uncharacterized protein n=1 Tax=Euplotes crassus TaxID=5936 RepID=A0AAD1U5B4_EUPCR|nr:unnamed protein product [Moneuplotes crassus]